MEDGLFISKLLMNINSLDIYKSKYHSNMPYANFSMQIKNGQSQIGFLNINVNEMVPTMFPSIFPNHYHILDSLPK